MKRFLLALGLVVILTFVGWNVHSKRVSSGAAGSEREAGIPQAPGVDAAIIIARRDADLAVSPPAKDKQILFGDLHVHSTYSTDAFLWALPLNHGKGVHPVADACDYARYCSAIDYWSITDHAEAGTPERWKRTKEAIRQCEAKSPDQSNPDLVSLVGFEWTQVGTVPDEHFGHKNVIFKGLEDDELPARTIASDSVATTVLRAGTDGMPAAVAFLNWEDRDVYYDFNTFLANTREIPDCDPNLPSSALPTDCYEKAKYPEELIARLEDQGLDPLIIPHGTSWGFYTPQGTTWDKQLKARHKPEKFSLIEVYSGHGNSEEFRDYANIKEIVSGKVAACVPPNNGFTPPCWRAGEIIEERCLAEGQGPEVCVGLAEEARDAAANMSISYHMAVNGETPEDWLTSGQCEDCYLPPFSHRPGTSVQYGLAASNFDDIAEGDDPRRFNWGFIASSDNHRARAGTGYKEVARRLTTEAGGPITPELRKMFLDDLGEADSTVTRLTQEELLEIASFQMTELERQSSFWQTGGLAAVHTDGRSREEIFDALERRETYATSGPRMLLWFDNIADDGAVAPMGATVDTSASGTFKVKAVGSFKQKPGCPDYAEKALGSERMETLCSGECYNPSDERNLITRIEIIRIRPQITEGEAIKNLIDDTFMVHDCEPDQSGCEFEFTDPEFGTAGRDMLYYARAIQEPRPTINGEPIKCERDGNGDCIKAEICHGDYRSGESDCLTMKDVRAWSSPIYLNYPQGVQTPAQPQ
ncbi:MAG: DUF3604 domain-containing protein [Maricaulaceae bacterium]